jgi:hypothetical protein
MKATPRRSRTSYRPMQHALVWLSAVIAGGTVFGTCEIRLHDALINGTKLWISQILDPSNIDFTADGDTAE